MRPDRWTRHIVGQDSPSDVGCIALDVTGDGRLDLIAGGVWYRNSGDYSQPFERYVFDASLEAVHDIVAADIDGDGVPEIITMSDKNDLRWYKISENTSDPWPHRVIGPAVHAGVAVGDLDGDGDLDIVRTNVWFEKCQGRRQPMASAPYRSQYLPTRGFPSALRF